MSFSSDYLKETGLIPAYQNFLKHLLNNLPKKENALEEASKFFSNYEKKYKPSTKIQPPLLLPEKPVTQKERKKITLETKSRVFPSAPVITPKIFERQERTRPLIGSYKTEEIQYEYKDIFIQEAKAIEKEISLHEAKAIEKEISIREANITENSDLGLIENAKFEADNSSISSKHSAKSRKSKKSSKSKRSLNSKSKKSKKSEDSEKSSNSSSDKES